MSQGCFCYSYFSPKEPIFFVAFPSNDRQQVTALMNINGRDLRLKRISNEIISLDRSISKYTNASMTVVVESHIVFSETDLLDVQDTRDTITVTLNGNSKVMNVNGYCIC